MARQQIIQLEKKLAVTRITDPLAGLGTGVAMQRVACREQADTQLIGKLLSMAVADQQISLAGPGLVG